MASPGRRSVAFDAWMDDFFASYYARRPVNATFVGVNLAFQMALLDPAAPTPVSYVVSNAMLWTIQP